MIVFTMKDEKQTKSGAQCFKKTGQIITEKQNHINCKSTTLTFKVTGEQESDTPR